MRIIKVAAALLLGACGPEVVLAPDRPDVAEPEVLAASVACERDGDEEHWVFVAEVADADGVDDIRAVHAYVYDEVTDLQVANYPLLPTEDDPTRWEARLPAPETSLNCEYESYSVDFLVTDEAGNSGIATAWTRVAFGV